MWPKYIMQVFCSKQWSSSQNNNYRWNVKRIGVKELQDKELQERRREVGGMDEQYFKSGHSSCRARSRNTSKWTNRTDGRYSGAPRETGAGLTNAEACGGGGADQSVWAGPPAESPAAGLFGDSLFPRTSETRCEAIFCKDCRTSWMFRLGATVHFIYSLYLLRLLHQSRAICMVKTLWETFPKESVCSPPGKSFSFFFFS